MSLIKDPILFKHAADNLSANVLLQATNDYCNAKNNLERGKIIKDLRSEWMIFLTNGMSEMVASKLKEDPKGIAQRLRRAIKNEKSNIYN